MGDDLHRQAPGREAVGHGLPPGSALLEQDFDAGSLYALRAAVSAHGADAGLTRSRLYDLVTVAHELAANAVRHGAGRGRLLHCEVSDAGRAPAAGGQAREAAGGRLVPADGNRPPWREEHGHGLWVVSRVADQFRIGQAGAATTATADFRLDDSPDQQD
jgi:anti-sigma regulatory factor (Ser/Thr protein kinase)